MDDNKEILDESSDKKLKIKANKLKTFIPPEVKKYLIIGGAIFGIVFFLLIFIVLVPSWLLLLYDNSENSNDSNLVYIESNSEDNYWWPIGGSEIEELDGIEYATGSPTSTNITSYYGPRESDYHRGIDIGSSGVTDYVIAVAKGIVYKVGTDCDNNGYRNNQCNYGMGNYVVIEHSGGNYTRYAHLRPNSITVSEGDTVNQGQIIGIMGNSGDSSGTHLDFKIFIGGYNVTASNPLEYISPDNPRPVTIVSGTASTGEITGDNQMLAMLQSWEGGAQYISGDNCIVYDDGYGYLSVGHGVAIGFNTDKFAKRGIDVSTLKAGSKIKKSIVDSIEMELIEEKRASVLSVLSNNGITLEDYQIDALIIRLYNVGNLNNFASNYKKYGNTQSLYDNFMSKPVTSNGVYSDGLVRRRQAEWNLFHNGIYTYNS